MGKRQDFLVTNAAALHGRSRIYGSDKEESGGIDGVSHNGTRRNFGGRSVRFKGGVGGSRSIDRHHIPPVIKRSSGKPPTHCH